MTERWANFEIQGLEFDLSICLQPEAAAADFARIDNRRIELQKFYPRRTSTDLLSPWAWALERLSLVRTLCNLLLTIANRYTSLSYSAATNQFHVAWYLY